MATSVKPNIAGGRTLSRLHRGTKSSGGGANKKRRGVWFEVNGRAFGGPARHGSHLQGDPKRRIPTR